MQQPVLCQTPAAAWEPVWCSWYGIKNEVNAEYILGMAPLLAAWGFGSVIIDAGWFEPQGFDEQTGHYVPDEGKFPDLRGLIEQLQAQGLRVLLWCAPLFRLQDVDQEPFIRRRDAADALPAGARGAAVRAPHGGTPHAGVRGRWSENRHDRRPAGPGEAPLHRRP